MNNVSRETVKKGKNGIFKKTLYNRLFEIV